MNDIYKTINNQLFKRYDDSYYISAYGDVYSCYKHEIMIPYITRDGYYRVDIHGKHMKVHKLVYLTWIGPIPTNMQINHIDDNKKNNHYLNLYAGTQKENIQDCIKNNHRVGNSHILILFDKEKNKTIKFYPAKNFYNYCKHNSANGSLDRTFKTDWFTKRYRIIKFESINKGVTTTSDEFNLVG